MSISPEEQGRLALPENRDERMVRWQEYCQSLMDYQRDKGREAAYKRYVMSEAKTGTVYTPTLVGKLAESAGRDLLPEWQRLKAEAYQAGMAMGSKYAKAIAMGEWGEWDDLYLRYMYLLGAGQAIANHGRDLIGVENIAAKAQDTEGKNR